MPNAVAVAFSLFSKKEDKPRGVGAKDGACSYPSRTLLGSPNSGWWPRLAGWFSGEMENLEALCCLSSCLGLGELNEEEAWSSLL